MFLCLVLSCLVLSCRVVSCRVVSCLVLSCLVLSCLVLPDFVCIAIVVRLPLSLSTRLISRVVACPGDLALPCIVCFFLFIIIIIIFFFYSFALPDAATSVTAFLLSMSFNSSSLIPMPSPRPCCLLCLVFGALSSFGALLICSVILCSGGYQSPFRRLFL